LRPLWPACHRTDDLLSSIGKKAACLQYLAEAL
jgi:hypothetical protein